MDQKTILLVLSFLALISQTISSSIENQTQKKSGAKKIHFGDTDVTSLQDPSLQSDKVVVKRGLIKLINKTPLNLEDVILYLYSNSKNGIVLTKDNLNEVDIASTLVFVIHGWRTTVNTTNIKDLLNAYLKKGNYNVVQVDWSKLAFKTYPESAVYVKDIGNYLGDIIAKLHKHHEANLNRIQITGHSLGAQVAGATGRAVKKILNSKVSRITGLDPARPLFEDIQFRSIGRLTKEDAELVVVVHTDGGGYGYLLSAGHVDFFPNRGVASQPGCLSQDVNGSNRCSHGRSAQFFVEALENSNGFVSTKCISYWMYLTGVCNYNRQITLGADLTLEDEGDYYLQTNPESPYSKE